MMKDVKSIFATLNNDPVREYLHQKMDRTKLPNNAALKVLPWKMTPRNRFLFAEQALKSDRENKHSKATHYEVSLFFFV